MANRRMITSDIFSDDWYGQLGFFEQQLWIGLFARCADDQGRLLDNVYLIRAALFPYKDVSSQEVNAALEGFVESGRLLRYEADGKALIQIANWWDHQKPRWAAASQWPAPEGWQDRVRTRVDGKYVEHNWNSAGGFTKASEDVHTSAQYEDADDVHTVGQYEPPHTVGQDPIPNPNPNPDPNNTSAREPQSSSPSFQEQAIRAYENAIGLVSGALQAQEIGEYAARLEAKGVTDWWERAIQACADQNKRKWAYMRAVLKEWLAQGYASANGGGPPRASPAAPTKLPEVMRLRNQFTGAIEVWKHGKLVATEPIAAEQPGSGEGRPGQHPDRPRRAPPG